MVIQAALGWCGPVSDEQSAQQRRLASAAHQRRLQQELHDNLRQLQVSFRTPLSAGINSADALGHSPGSQQTQAAAAAAAAAAAIVNASTVTELTECMCFGHA